METGADDEPAVPLGGGPAAQFAAAAGSQQTAGAAAAAAAAAGAASGGEQEQDGGGGGADDADPEAAAEAAADDLQNTMAAYRKRRREEVEALLCRVLVVRCQADYGDAPVITNPGMEANIFHVLERHVQEGYLHVCDRFWRTVRTFFGVDVWRPRVRGMQLRALLGVRLPLAAPEFDAIQAVFNYAPDCLRADTSVAALMEDLRGAVARVQAWWGSRSAQGKDGGPLKRGGWSAGPPPGGKRARTLDLGAQPDQHAAYYGDEAAAYGAAAGYMQGAPEHGMLGSSNGMAYQAGGFGQAGLFGGEGGMAAATAAAAAAAGLPATSSGHAAAAGAASGAPATALPSSLSPGAAAAASAAAAGGVGPHAGPHAGPAGRPVTSFIMEPHCAINLDVGGRRFRTTLNTLLSVQNSLFWAYLVPGAGVQLPPVRRGQTGLVQRLPSGELFIDRCGDHFHFILEYLRASASHDLTFPLPEDARALQEVAREAAFYGLPELIHHIAAQSVLPRPMTRTLYDMAYLETGFIRVGEDLAVMERQKVELMQQLNHVVQRLEGEGFAVDHVETHMARREGAGGAMEVNLLAKALLRKVLTVLPDGLLPPPEEEDGDEYEDEEEYEGDGEDGEGEQQPASSEEEKPEVGRAAAAAPAGVADAAAGQHRGGGGGSVGGDQAGSRHAAAGAAVGAGAEAAAGRRRRGDRRVSADSQGATTASD